MVKSVLFSIPVALSVVLCLLTDLPIMAKTAGGHASDTIELLFGKPNAHAVSVRSILMHEFNPAIDNMRVMNTAMGGHRLYGHWGFSGRIPFKRNPNLRRYIQANPRMKKVIIEAWKKDQEKMLEAVSKFVRLTDRKRLRGFTGILYDMHLLGDWSTQNTADLQKIDDIVKDLRKNVQRTFQDDKAYAKRIAGELDDLVIELKKNSKRMSPKKQAETVLRYLKEHPTLGKRLGRYLGNVSPELASKYGVRATLVRGVSWAIGPVAAALAVLEVTWELRQLEQRRRQETACRKAERTARWNLLIENLDKNNAAIEKLLVEG